MLTAYEENVLSTYLANAASRLRPQDREAQELFDWVAEHENYTVLGDKGRFRDKSLILQNSDDKIISPKSLGSLEQTLRRECSAATVRPDRTAERLKSLGKTIGLNQMDLSILELLLRCKT